MLAGPLEGNRKLFEIFSWFLNYLILLYSVMVFVLIGSYAYIYTSNGVSLMNWRYHSQKAASILPRIMITCASFVQMVGIFCFVMDAQGPSTKVKYKL